MVELVGAGLITVAEVDILEPDGEPLRLRGYVVRSLPLHLFDALHDICIELVEVLEVVGLFVDLADFILQDLVDPQDLVEFCVEVDHRPETHGHVERVG